MPLRDVPESQSIEVDKSLIPSLNWIKDFEYFEGALTSLFMAPSTEDLYFSSWCDVDATCNRWSFSKVTQQAVDKYLRRHFSAQDLILYGSDTEEVFFADRSNEKWEKVCSVKKEHYQILVGIGYIPPTKAYYDPELEPPEL